MAAKAFSLPIGGDAYIQESFRHGNVRLQPSKKSAKVSLIPHINDVPTTRLSKVAMTSEPRKLHQEKSILSSVPICADTFGTDEKIAMDVTADRLHQWMTESVMEIVRDIREAPFLYYIFERNVSSATPKRQRVHQDVLEGADSWPILRNSLRTVLPDGVILVKRLDEQSVHEYSIASESEKGDGMQDFDKSGCTNIWGLLIQGRGVGLSACYILKTTEIMSAHGCWTECVLYSKDHRDHVSAWVLYAILPYESKMLWGIST